MANMLTANKFNVIDFRHLCPLAACDTEKQQLQEIGYSDVDVW